MILPGRFYDPFWSFGYGLLSMLLFTAIHYDYGPPPVVVRSREDPDYLPPLDQGERRRWYWYHCDPEGVLPLRRKLRWSVAASAGNPPGNPGVDRARVIWTTLIGHQGLRRRMLVPADLMQAIYTMRRSSRRRGMISTKLHGRCLDRAAISECRPSHPSPHSARQGEQIGAFGNAGAGARWTVEVPIFS